MRRLHPVLFLLALLVVSSLEAQGLRKAVWAGKFYDHRAEVLSAQVDQFISLGFEQTAPLRGIKALIAPHAGYPYSGRVAGAAYGRVRGKAYKTVVVIGTSHRYGFRSCSIYAKGGYETPLGVVPVDEKLAGQLSKASGFRYVAKAHREEHSVEVQIPFIQRALPDAKIVPLVMGFPSRSTIVKLAKALHEVLEGKEALVVASTDMSHFNPKEKANEIDAETIALIRSLETSTIIRRLERGEGIMCGGGPVAAALLYAEMSGPVRVEILEYADSAEAGGPESQVVGYLAAAVCAQEEEAPLFAISMKEQEALLQIARASIEAAVEHNQVFKPSPSTETLRAKRGAFVTLKKRGRLRGCIGFIEPVLPLCQAVAQAAVYAATRDTRFPPVSSSELKALEIEISVLSPIQRISDPSLIQVGRHGILIRKGNRSGLLLPQVATDNRWSRATFLDQACLKAGLPRNAWKSGAEIYVFESIVFH